MLESPSLLILPWTPAPATRPVRAGTTGAPLGLVRPAGRPRPWLPWLRPLRLEVLETEDDSLLLTLTRSWLRLWDLYDAEDQRIGSFYPPVLLDAEGLRRGYLRAAGARHGDLLSSAGHPLAAYALDAAGALHLDFAADLGPNPFLRMLLLGAALTLQPPA